jgi:membrane fusion protein (multidrug efflux system)
MMLSQNINKSSWIVIGTATFLLASCGNDKGGQPQQVKSYKVIELDRSSTVLYSDYPARLQGVLDIDIRPKIDGYIEKVWVDEGQEVKAGQVLFTINNPQFAQDVTNTQAAITSAEAAVASAKLQVQKTKPLVEQGIISAFELETAILNLHSKEAALAQARAIHNNSKINLGYTKVVSPANGVVGLLPYRVGSYVNSNTVQPLTTISDISKMYAYFSLNEKQQLAFVEATSGNNFQEKIKQMPAIDLILSNGEMYSEKGKIETFSGQVNVQTGAFNVRAGFPNVAYLLRSGSSATVRIPIPIENAIIIPQAATTELQNKRMAYVVGDSSKVKAVAIEVRPVPGGQFFVVDKGLKEKDNLIVEGIGILTEGTPIVPQLVPMDSVIIR